MNASWQGLSKELMSKKELLNLTECVESGKVQFCALGKRVRHWETGQEPSGLVKQSQAPRQHIRKCVKSHVKKTKPKAISRQSAGHKDGGQEASGEKRRQSTSL